MPRKPAIPELMGPTVTISGVQLKSFGRKEVGTASFSATLNRPIQKLLKWAPMPDGYPSATPGGEIVGRQMKLGPAKGELAIDPVIVDIGTASGFQIVRRETKGKRGKGFRLELHFKIQFPDITGCAKLEAYSVATQGTVSVLEIAYTPKSKEPEQAEIPDVKATDEQRQAALELDTEEDEDEDDEDDEDDEEDDE